jgi:hypothetical protein
MANTYTKIASVSVGSGGASSMDFTSIPSTYTDLLLKVSVRSPRASNVNDYMKITFNGSTTTYSGIMFYGNGSSAVTSTFAAAGASQYAGDINASTSTSNTFTSVDIYIPNYAGSTNKSYSVDAGLENNATFGQDTFAAGLWSTTSAITSISLTGGVAGSVVQYSTATLYGISNS